MDEELLRSKGIRVNNAAPGFADGFQLRIGTRATLVPDPESRAYGVVMEANEEDVRRLYNDPSVADYVAEEVTVTLPEGNKVRAACYNLPESKLAGSNPQYAESLLSLATKLGFPEPYLKHISQYLAAVRR